MTRILAPLAALLILAAPVQAGGIVFDLPSLTWPDDDQPTVTRGCAMPVTPAVCASR